MLQTYKVVGAKPSKGTMDNGRSFDSTKVYIEVKFRDGVGSGYSTAEYNWGDAQNYEKIKDLQYPFDADIEFEMVTTGKVSTFVIVEFLPKTKVVTPKTN